MSDKTPIELAEAYFESLERRTDESEYNDAKERLEGLQERLEKFKDAYGESDQVTEELRQKVQSAEARVEEINQERREPEEIERELLEAATEFVLNEEWLQQESIKALNRVLIGSSDSYLRIEEVEIAGFEDAEDLDELARYDIIDIVRKVALSKLGRSDDIQRVWESIEGTAKEGAFRVVGEKGGASTSDVIEYLDEDIEKGVARNRLKNAVHQLDINPYHRENGTYYLSTVGQYIASEFANTENYSRNKSKESDSEESGETAENDGQTTLLEETSPSKGGGADE